MAQIVPEFQDMLSVYVESYNSTQKILTLFLLMADFDLTGTSDPYDYVVEQMNQLYEQATIELMEQCLGLAQVEAGENFPEFPSGTTIYIQEDYLLEECQPYGYIPASVVDYTQFEFLKYRKIRLIYRHKPDFPPASGWPRKPNAAWPGESCNPAYGYPPDILMGWPYPDIGDGNPLFWHNVFIEYGYTSPTAHWRYMILTDWMHLLTANPNEENLVYKEHMLEDVFDCFRPTMPSDGEPWWSEEYPFKWISKNINDDWVDSYNELVSRGLSPNAYLRAQRWISFTSYEYNVYHHPTQPITYVRLRMRAHDKPSKIYRPSIVGGGGGVLPAGTGLLGGVDVLNVSSWLWRGVPAPSEIFSVNGEDFEVNGEKFEVKS